MKQFLRQLPALACLLVLAPTVIVAPYAAIAMLVSIPRVVSLVFSPGSVAAFYPSHYSIGEVAGLEMLGMVWVAGYFVTGLALLGLLAPLSRKARFILWCLPVTYLLLMFLGKPWTTDVWGNRGFDPNFQIWAMYSLAILLPLCLSGLWFERPRRRMMPPPFPT